MSKGKELVRCDACDLEHTRKGTKAHVESIKHQRAVGALPPKPEREKPPPKPRGRPKTEGPLFRERNPDYYKTTYQHCSICEKDIIRGRMVAHRGSSVHFENAKLKWQAEAEGEKPGATEGLCAPCGA